MKRSGTVMRRRSRSVLRVLLCSISLAVMSCMAASASDRLIEGSRAYEFGDYSTAHAIWLPLAEQGNAKAQASLAYLYREGRGVRRDSETAAHWYYRAAVRGEPTAQSFLCAMHLHGDGVQRNLELALMWCELSIAGGETSGIWHREQVLNRMTTQQRHSAWRLVVKWRQMQIGHEAKPMLGDMSDSAAHRASAALTMKAATPPSITDHQGETR